MCLPSCLNSSGNKIDQPTAALVASTRKSDGKILRMKSIRVRSVDATGAGDAFNGGFLHGTLAGWPLEECLKAGNICGALATTGAGGSCAMPARKLLKELMKKLR